MRWLACLMVACVGCGGGGMTADEKARLEKLEAAQKTDVDPAKRVAEIALAKKRMKAIGTGISGHLIDSNKLPMALSVLNDPSPAAGLYHVAEENLTDPWGKPFNYDPAGTRFRDARKSQGKPLPDDLPRWDLWCVTPWGETVGNWD